MATNLTLTPPYLAEGPRVGIREWKRRDRSAIERWPAESLPEHWRAIAPHSGERISFAVVLLASSELLGRITLRDVASGAARIGIVVHPGHRGQGYGTEAIYAFLAVARAQRINVLRLDVAADNHGARAAYERAGFVEVGAQFRGAHRYLDMARGVW